MRTRIVWLAVIGSVLCSAPAFAQSEASSKPEQQEWIHGALIGGVAIPAVFIVASSVAQGCPRPGFDGFGCLAGGAIGLALAVPGALIGGWIEWRATGLEGVTTATLIPSTNGRDAVSLQLLVRF